MNIQFLREILLGLSFTVLGLALVHDLLPKNKVPTQFKKGAYQYFVHKALKEAMSNTQQNQNELKNANKILQLKNKKSAQNHIEQLKEIHHKNQITKHTKALLAALENTSHRM